MFPYKTWQIPHKHECKQKHTHMHVQTHMAALVSRSRVASDVFTLMWGDCYFCTELDNSIIHRRCWCTHFTSGRMEAGVPCSECVCVCVCVPLVMSIFECEGVCHVWEDLQQKMNCWHAAQHSRRGKRQEEKRKMNCYKHGNHRGSKSRGRRGKELVPLSSL